MWQGEPSFAQLLQAAPVWAAMACSQASILPTRWKQQAPPQADWLWVAWPSRPPPASQTLAHPRSAQSSSHPRHHRTVLARVAKRARWRPGEDWVDGLVVCAQPSHRMSLEWRKPPARSRAPLARASIAARSCGGLRRPAESRRSVGQRGARRRDLSAPTAVHQPPPTPPPPPPPPPALTAVMTVSSRYKTVVRRFKCFSLYISLLTFLSGFYDCNEHVNGFSTDHHRSNE